jgi:hypothetical protein
VASEVDGLTVPLSCEIMVSTLQGIMQSMSMPLCCFVMLSIAFSVMNTTYLHAAGLDPVR